MNTKTKPAKKAATVKDDNTPVARTYKITPGSLRSMEKFTGKVNDLALKKGIKVVDKSDVVNMLFNMAATMDPAIYFQQ